MCVTDSALHTYAASVVLLRDKAKAPEKMIHLCKKLQVKKGTMIARIGSDHGREFENTKLATFCNDQGTHQEFSSLKTPQQMLIGLILCTKNFINLFGMMCGN